MSKNRSFDGAQILVWIEITQLCQLKCRYCYNDWRSRPSRDHMEMSCDTFDAVLKFCEDLAVEKSVEFALAGGDPSAHAEYTSIASQLAKIAPVTIVSHGCSFKLGDLKRIAKIDHCQIQYSIPSLDVEQFAFMTGGGQLSAVLTNLAHSASMGIPSSISSVLSKQSLGTSHAAQIIGLARAAGVSRIIFNKFVPAGRGVLYDHDFSLADEQFVRYISQARKDLAAYDVEVFVSEPFINVRDFRVSNPKITISYDGFVKPCSMASHSIGSVSDSALAVIEKYREFWRGGGRDPGCICSQQDAAGKAKHLEARVKEAD